MPDPRRLAVAASLWALGLALAGAGLVLMLRAAWLALLPVWGPVATPLAMGGALLLGGALTLALASRRRPAPPPPVNPVANMVTAFVQGYDAAQALKARR